MSLHFSKRGSGEALVLIHGLFGSLENLGAIARLLANHFTVYSIDLPNHGKSSHTNSTGLQEIVMELIRWMDEQRLPAANVVGHSLGGKVAMELALFDPQRVGRMAVMDISPVHYNPHHNQVFEGLLAIDTATITRRGDADEILQAYVHELAVRSFLLKNLTKASDGQFQWRMNLPVIHRDYSQLIRGNAVDKIFYGDTLFLKGGASDYIKESHRETILQRFPNARLKIVDNSGHWLHAEKPEIVAKLISKFLID